VTSSFSDTCQLLGNPKNALIKITRLRQKLFGVWRSGCTHGLAPFNMDMLKGFPFGNPACVAGDTRKEPVAFRQIFMTGLAFRDKNIA